ncbi:cytochrome c1 [Cavenderia fasciculata]|uniref:Cytochrome c1 n=1 Tax=Cavenderia fasciculata TaxID=261658 RepID=F4QFI7_CACFS|nr:cytochrome c1 [Cavenderia fasciculata]EGG14288.1 cytochrome c1 [Cavenderia fasciculata]|eukprot:XP_004350997.1 cytochrome c1 [Cavenderia fasciculata]
MFNHLRNNALKYIGGVGISVAGVSSAAVYLSDDFAQPPEYPWNHRFPWQAFDHASIRRGHQVYTQVCSTCHSLDLVSYRHLIDVAYTAQEMKNLTAELTVMDGPDSEGDMFERKGTITDFHPKPYPNANAARYSNNGALPPDLSLVVKARTHHEDYIFALLTGYSDPPAGVKVVGGQHFNPYFPGTKIAMAPPLAEGALEYDDGTEASVSQMAKDVGTFLAWASEPEHDDRKKLGIKIILGLSIIALPMFYWKRLKWSTIKTRKIAFKD